MSDQHRLIKQFVVDIVGVVIVAGVFACFHHHPSFEELSWNSYGWGQRLAGFAAPADRPAVTVVDIGDLAEDVPEVLVDAAPVTPRRPLLQVLRTIVDLVPRAIAVDIDFAPDEEGWTVPAEDTPFLDACLGFTDRVPVFLGVHRTLRMENPSGLWLGLPEYQKLAAAIAVPKANTNTIPTWIQNGDQGLYSLSYRLAQHARGSPPAQSYPRGSFLSSLITRESVLEASDRVQARSIWLETWRLPTIREQTIRVSTTDDVRAARDRLVGRVVIVGDASGRADDLTVLPGVDGQVPRVYLHALAAETLVSGQLYLPTSRGEFALDVLVGVLAAVIILALNLALRRSGRRVRTFAFQFGMRFVLVLSLIVFGVFLAARTRFFWQNFIIVGVWLILAPVVEYILHWLGTRLLDGFRRMLRLFVRPE